MWQKVFCQHSEHVQDQEYHFTKPSKTSQQLSKRGEDTMHGFEGVLHLCWAHPLQEAAEGLKSVAKEPSHLSFLGQHWGRQEKGKLGKTPLD